MAYHKIPAHVYLIHLDGPLAHARHYIGYTALEDVSARLARHKRGDGARLLRAANLQGISYRVVRLWDCATIREARDLERQLKARKDAPSLCPVCNPRAAHYLVLLPTQNPPEGGISPDCNPNISLPF